MASGTRLRRRRERRSPEARESLPTKCNRETFCPRVSIASKSLLGAFLGAGCLVISHREVIRSCQFCKALQTVAISARDSLFIGSIGSLLSGQVRTRRRGLARRGAVKFFASTTAPARGGVFSVVEKHPGDIHTSGMDDSGRNSNGVTLLMEKVGHDIELVSELQSIHDNVPIDTWEDRFKQTCRALRPPLHVSNGDAGA
jgi:hypothetical protein